MMPCKHMMAVFSSNEELNWNSLPSCYKDSPYFSLDDLVIHPFNINNNNTNDDDDDDYDNNDIDDDNTDEVEEANADVQMKEIPKKVFYNFYSLNFD